MSELVSPDECRQCPVLYVDDEVENLLGFQMTLRRKFRILTASSALEALDIMAREPVAVLVTDQRMPEITGVELIRRAKPLYPDTVFLILTGYTDYDAMVEGINTGVLSGYIAKPWDRGEVETLLSTAIERHLLSRHLRLRTRELAELNRALEAKVEERTAELRRFLESLNRANLQLAQLNHLKNEFLGVCSHDLKSPLTALGGYIDLMEERLRRGADFSHIEAMFTSLRGVLDEMGKLVNDVLDLSRLEAGKENLNLASTPLAETLDKALAILRPLAETKGLKLSVEVESGLPPLAHDAARVAQLVGNLVSNAIKFTHAGGSVSIRVNRDSVHGQRIEVRDTGIGFDPTLCERILTEGANHRRPGTAGEQSSGLGLAICHKIVSLHRGSIRAESEPGVGSLFTVHLPDLPPALIDANGVEVA
jgi:signal transduction histidine kinase